MLRSAPWTKELCLKVAGRKSMIHVPVPCHQDLRGSQKKLKLIQVKLLSEQNVFSIILWLSNSESKMDLFEPSCCLKTWRATKLPNVDSCDMFGRQR